MTAQIGDRFKFEGTEYSIVAISKPLGFDPTEYGITPESVSTACWKGFWCIYNITESGIFLEDLYINSKDGCYPEIGGIKPLSEKNKGEHFCYMGHHLYKGLNIQVPYSGKILVGDEFIRKYYIHMGYQRAWAYKILTELIFENGVLVETNDLSQIAAELREEISKDKDFEKKLHSNIPEFVRDNFALDYGTKAWWL